MIETPLPGVDKTELMRGIEVVIQPQVELIAVVLVVGVPVSQIRAADSSSPLNTGRVQAITHGEIVRLRHVRQQYLAYETGRVIAGPLRIKREHVDLLNAACGGRRTDRIPVEIHCRIGDCCIRVVGAGEVPE